MDERISGEGARGNLRRRNLATSVWLALALLLSGGIAQAVVDPTPTPKNPPHTDADGKPTGHAASALQRRSR